MLHRFISEDPAEFTSGDVNLYAYGSNQPADATDPLGLEPVTISAGLAVGIVCATGAVAGDVVVLAVNGRKTTLGQLGAGAAIGCAGGVVVLGAYAAGAAMTVSHAAQSVATTTVLTAVTMRDALLRAAQHPSLQKVINELYRIGAKIGDGGTAAIARHELPKGDFGHAEKALNYARRLDTLLKEGALNAADSKLARIIRNDLISAGSGK